MNWLMKYRALVPGLKGRKSVYLTKFAPECVLDLITLTERQLIFNPAILHGHGSTE